MKNLRRIHMHLEPETKMRLEELCCQLGLHFSECPCGVVVESAEERFLLKITKNQRVSKLYHENFRRNGSKMPLRYCYSDLTQEVLKTYYHVQKFPGTDVQQVVSYIYYHSKNRRLMNQKCNIVLRKKFC